MSDATTPTCPETCLCLTRRVGHLMFNHLFKESRLKICALIRLNDGSFRSPKVEKNLVSALRTWLAVIWRNGTASGNLVAAHMIVNKYWLPDFDLGRGPTQSTMTRSKGSVTGIGCNGAGGIVWLGFPVTWQMWQLQQKRGTSCFNPGQKKCCNRSRFCNAKVSGPLALMC